MITFACGGCGRSFVAEDQQAGRRGTCRRCGGVLVVPVPAVVVPLGKPGRPADGLVALARVGLAVVVVLIAAVAWRAWPAPDYREVLLARRLAEPAPDPSPEGRASARDFWTRTCRSMPEESHIIAEAARYFPERYGPELAWGVMANISMNLEAEGFRSAPREVLAGLLRAMVEARPNRRGRDAGEWFCRYYRAMREQAIPHDEVVAMAVWNAAERD